MSSTAAILVGNVHPATRAGLKRLAADHGRSLDAELCAILDAAVVERPRIDWSKPPKANTGRGGRVTRDEICVSSDDN